MTSRNLRAGVAVLAALLCAALLALLSPSTGAAGRQATATSRAAAADEAGLNAQPTGQPSAEPAGQQGVQVLLDAVQPATLTPGSTLKVLATVVNGTSTALENGEVRLWVRSQRTPTRSLLDDWAAGRLGSGTLRKTVPLGASLPPGSSKTVDVEVPADELGLPTGAFEWGPRGIAVEVLDASLASRAVVRSFVVWQADPGGYEPTDVTVVLPLTDGPPDVLTGQVPPDSLDTLTGPGGRLRAVLGAAALPGVTWALDPSVLGEAAPAAAPSASASPGTPTPPATTASPPPGAPPPAPPVQDWQDSVRLASLGHEIVVLPYGDPDVNALAHAGQLGTYELAERYGRQTAQAVLGAPGRSDVAWPVSGSLDDETAAMLVAAGRSSVILSGGSHPAARPDGSTPTGRSEITVDRTSVAGLLVDTPLSTLLGSLGPGPRAPEADRKATTAVVVQRLLAETAAITLERPFDPRHVLVASPRGWDPGADAAVAAVRALTAAPWVRAKSLADLISTRAPDVTRTALRYPDADRADELPAAGLRQASAALASIRTSATILANPAPVVRAAELSVVAAASAGWRDDRPGWHRSLAALSAQAASMANGVKALPGSGITVVSSQVSLPVTLENALDQEATVRVRLQPRSSRLVVEEPVLEDVSIGAHSQRRVSIPVQAVGNGNTDVAVQVLTPSGVELGTPVVLPVRVRADWETRGTLLLGVAIGLVLLVGLVRAVRRGRRQHELRDPLADRGGDPEEEPAHEPEPHEPEPHEPEPHEPEPHEPEPHEPEPQERGA